MVGKTSSDDELDTPDSPGLPNLTPPYRSRSKKSVLKPLTELSDEERAEKLKQQSLTNEYHRFVEGHLILKQGKEQTIFKASRAGSPSRHYFCVAFVLAFQLLFSL